MISVKKGRRRPGRAAAPGRAARISVLLADDHEVVRQGLRALLEAERDIVVVGDARDGRMAVEMTGSLRPDVVVMDIAMPQLNGLEATRQIIESRPETRVLILSAHSDDEYVRRAAEVGAVGYVLKQTSLADLAVAIREARPGQMFVSPTIAQRMSGPGATPSGRAASASKEIPRLTVREAEVLQLIVEGKANKESARALGISIKTVEKHRQSLMTKLDIHDVAGLTHYAIAAGVVEGRAGRGSF